MRQYRGRIKDSTVWVYGEIIGNIYENPELLKGEETA
jgi:hypothetical protein